MTPPIWLDDFSPLTPYRLLEELKEAWQRQVSRIGKPIWRWLVQRQTTRPWQMGDFNKDLRRIMEVQQNPRPRKVNGLKCLYKPAIRVRRGLSTWQEARHGLIDSHWSIWIWPAIWVLRRMEEWHEDWLGTLSIDHLYLLILTSWLSRALNAIFRLLGSLLPRCTLASL